MGDPAKEDDVQCLTDDVIHQFLTGELDDEQDQLVADHLEYCGACQRLTMSFLSVDDLCLPWLKASDRDTIELGGKVADTVTINRLKMMPQTGDGPDQVAGSPGRKSNHSVNATVPNTIDKYEIVTVIGQGGMGTVYLGIDHDLGRECAIKVLKESRSNDAKAIDRSQREMHAVGRLSHRNIVSVLNAGRLSDGRTFLAMEFLRGSDLQTWIQANGPLQPEEACRIVVDAARGLRHAHEQGLIHRDVKPSNLFLTEAGEIKVLDFGLVQLAGESLDQDHPLTETGLVLGTVDFMSPEQAVDSRSVDPRSDIYSLGCTLAWLLSGKQVFSGNSVTKILFAHRDDPAPQLETLLPSVPAGLNDVFQKMVAKRPEDRFQSMADVIKALIPFTLSDCGEPLTDLSPSSETQVLPALRQTPIRSRNRAMLGWLSAMVILGIVITLVIRQSDNNSPQLSAQAFGVPANSAGTGSSLKSTEQTVIVDSPDAEIHINIETDSGKSAISLTPTGDSVPQSRVPSLDKTVTEIDWRRTPVVSIQPLQTLVISEAIDSLQVVSAGAIHDLDFSGDGSDLMVAVGHGVQFWDVSGLPTARLRLTLPVSDEATVRAAERLSDGHAVLTVNSDHSAIVHQLDGETRQTLDAGKGSAFTSLSLSDDGSRAWAGTYHAFGGRVVEFDLQAGTVSRWVQIEPELPGSACLRLSASPDETLLAAGGALEGGVVLIETETFSERLRLPTLGPIRSLAFSTDGSFVVTSGDHDCLRAWNVTTGEELWRVPDTGPCCAMEFSPDGSKLFISTYPGSNLRLMTLDVARRKMLSIINTPWACDSLAIDPQGRFVAAGNGSLSNRGNGRILVWRTETLLGRRPSEIPATASTH